MSQAHQFNLFSAPEGVFVNRTLLEKTRYFLTRAAKGKSIK